jgi:hypothetical protein
METTSNVQASENKVGWVTPAILLALIGVGLLFAFKATDVSTTWFGIFKLIHVSVAVFWVGGGLLLTALAIRAQRSDDPGELATIARQATFVGEKLFAPAGGVALAMGIAMVINSPEIGFGDAAPETQAAIRKILLIARIDVAVLLVVVMDMLVKPFS